MSLYYEQLSLHYNALSGFYRFCFAVMKNVFGFACDLFNCAFKTSWIVFNLLFSGWFFCFAFFRFMLRSWKKLLFISLNRPSITYRWQKSWRCKIMITSVGYNDIVTQPLALRYSGATASIPITTWKWIFLGKHGIAIWRAVHCLLSQNDLRGTDSIFLLIRDRIQSPHEFW